MNIVISISIRRKMLRASQYMVLPSSRAIAARLRGVASLCPRKTQRSITQVTTAAGRKENSDSR